MIHGFAPIVGSDARVLVLGSVPGVRSLKEGCYYADPRNAFWRIMEYLFAKGAGLNYPQRVQMLKTAGVAVWDVLHAAERQGSLDSDIRPDSEIPNDIAGFLREHSTIHIICFNGGKPEQLFNKHIDPALHGQQSLKHKCLPSTSSANARLTFEQKVAAWAAVVTAI